MRHLRFLAITLTLAACSGPADGGDGGPDAARPMDAGGADAAIGVDASPPEDAAIELDAGGDDAGTMPDAAMPDAGATQDAGTLPDGGATADAGVDAAADSGATPDAGPSSDAGGGCTQNAECAATEFCAKAPGDCMGTGTCTTTPGGICPAVFMPVCGCDGVTYSNACRAAAAGMNVASSGSCGASGCALTPTAACCFEDADCGSGDRCEGATCAAGGEGTCVTDTLSIGQCWNDGDCSGALVWTGARRCPCGALCILPDSPGSCTAP